MCAVAQIFFRLLLEELVGIKTPFLYKHEVLLMCTWVWNGDLKS
jgi:hypothetical protein